MSKCVSAWHADQVCLEIPNRFDTFPSLREIEAIIQDMRPASNQMPYFQDKAWVSERVPGIPPILEALCEHFLKSTIDKPHVIKMVRYSGYSLDELWCVYEMWHQGKLHPLCLDYDKRTRGRLIEHLMEDINPPLRAS